MKITQLKIDGIKTHNNRNINLSGLDVITAPNGTGKTGVREALELGIQGYVHTLGKRPADQMQISNNGKISVDLTTETGFNFNRIIKGNTSSASQSVKINSKKTGVREADKEIEIEIGSYPVMFDLAEFTKLSDDKKRQFIFQFAKNTDSDNFKIDLDILFQLAQQIIGEQGFNILMKHSDNSYGSIINEIGEDYKNLLDKFEFKNDDDSELNRALEFYKDELKSVNRKIKDTQATKRKLLSEKQKYKTRSQGLADLKKSIEILEKKKDELLTEIQKIKNSQTNIKSLIDKKKELQESIELIECKINEFPDQDAIKKLKNDLIEAEKKSIELNKSETIKIEQSTKIQYVKSDLMSKIVNISKTIDTILNLKDSIKEIVSEVISSDDKNKHVPFNNGLEEKIEDKINQIVNKKQKEVENIQQQQKQLDEEQSKNQTEVDKISDLSRELILEIDKIKKSIPDDFKILHLNEKKEFYEKELVKVNDDISKQAVYADDEDLQKQLNTTILSIKEIKELINKKQEAKTMLKTILKQLEDENTETDTADQLKNIISAIETVRNNIVIKFTEPLKSRIDGLLKEINPNWECYFNLQKGFEFGLQRGSVHVPYDGLSGGEDKLFSAALATALMQLENPKLKVLSIEAAEVDGDNLNKLLSGLSKLSDHVDNIIVATWYDKFELPENWNKISLTA